jgi:hypothetical protein
MKKLLLVFCLLSIIFPIYSQVKLDQKRLDGYIQTSTRVSNNFNYDTGMFEKTETQSRYYSLPTGEYEVVQDLNVKYTIVVNGDVSIYTNSKHKITTKDFDSSFDNSMFLVPMGLASLTIGGGNNVLTISSKTPLKSILSVSGNLTMLNNVEISKCDVDYGVVYISAGKTFIDGAIIIENESKVSCSGIYVVGGTLDLSSGILYDNYVNTENRGACIYNGGDARNTNVRVCGLTLSPGKAYNDNIMYVNIKL